MRKLLAMMNHTAGATVRHKSPFSDLKVPTRRIYVSRRMIKRWIQPFYLGRPSEPEWAEALRPLLGELDEDLVRRLLSYFNWRPRLVGAYFATVRGDLSLEEEIGRLLLRSDVCYAGQGYALALASFSTPSALGYLTQYLDYYLEQPDLWFDQAHVMAAVAHLDRRNGTHVVDAYRERWARFTSNKPNVHLEETCERFECDLRALSSLRE
ncbi:MAG: DUF6000 family protein [Myxococcota bacterium]